MFTYNLQPFVSVLPGAIVSVAYLPTSDDFDLLIKAARVTPVEHREEMEPGALEYVIDVMRTTREPAWNVIVDEFDVIMARPGSGMAFVELLTHAEHCRLEDGDPSGVVRAKIDQMIAFLVSKAGDGMEAYDRSDEGSQRPADIYRAFGPALKYATSTLGSFAARAMLRRLSLETTMPFSELENPDWIDPYTGQGEKSYSQVRVRKLEDVSCAGNIPTTLADMLENMEQNDRAEFELMLTRCGWTLDDYWLQFQEAQRGGFNPIADEGEEHVEVEFDVIEKDFEYKEDYTTTTALEGLRSMYAKELKGMRDVLRELGHGLVILRRQPERVAWAEKWLRPQVRHSEPFRRMFKFVKSIAHLYEPQDLLALLLPFQNEIGYSLADLAEIKIPGQYHNLDEWYRTFEEQFLSQFTDQAGRMEPEPIGDELDGYVEELIGERVRVYLSPEAELRYEQTLAAAKGKRSEREAKAWTAFWGVQAKSLSRSYLCPHQPEAAQELGRTPRRGCDVEERPSQPRTTMPRPGSLSGRQSPKNASMLAIPPSSCRPRSWPPSWGTVRRAPRSNQAGQPGARRLTPRPILPITRRSKAGRSQARQCSSSGIWFRPTAITSPRSRRMAWCWVAVGRSIGAWQRSRSRRARSVSPMTS